MLGIIIAMCSIVGWLIWTNAYYPVEDGYAMIRSGLGGSKVYFKGGFWAYPLVHQVEKLKIREQRILLNQTGLSIVRTKDNIRVDIQLTFFVQVKHVSWAVLSVAQTIGCQSANQKIILNQYFQPKFSALIESVVKTFDYQTLFTKRGQFKKALLLGLDENLGGYQLNRINIAVLKYTPLDEYDVDYNVLDADGYKNLKEMLGNINDEK